MAYGAKYNLDFKDNQGTAWRYDILKKDYVGANTKIKGSGTPVVINWRGGELYNPIRSSEAIVNIYSETNFQFSEFFTAGGEDYLLQIKRSGTLWWEGVNVVETYSEPYTLPPYTIKMRFTDGLGNLKYKEYAMAVGDLGLLWVITKCLDNLPFPVKKNIVEVINILENQITENASNWFLNSTSIRQELFKKFNNEKQADEGWTCYDVIKEIMIANGCTMYQANNEWYIVRIEELQNVTPAYVRYDGAGAILNSGTITIRKAITNTEVGITWLYQDAELSISEVFNEIDYVYKFPTFDFSGRTEQNLIRDSNMELGSTASGQANKFPFWQIVGMTPGTDLSKYNPNINYDSGDDWEHDWVIIFNQSIYWTGLKVGTPVLDLTKYIKPLWTSGTIITRTLQVVTADISELRIAGEFGLQIYHQGLTLPDATQLNTIYNLDFYFSISIGTYYLQDVVGVLSWVVDSTKTIRIRKDVRVGDYEQIFAAGSESGTQYFFDRTLLLPAFPENGEKDLTIKMYAPVNPVIDNGTRIIMMNYINLFNFNFNFKPSNATFINQKLVALNNIPNVRDNIKEVQVKMGDEPFLVVSSCYRVIPTGQSQQVKADRWHIRGSGTLFEGYEIFILRPYSKFYGKYRQEIKATLYGNDTFEFYNVLTTDGKGFMQDGLSYDIKKAEKNIQLLELGVLVYVWNGTLWDFGITIIPFPSTVITEDIVISKQEASKKLMQNNETHNISNVNLTKKSAAIKLINNKTGTDTDYTSYPG